MGKFIKNKKILLLLILLGVFIASETVALEVNWPPSPAGTQLTPDSTLPDLIKYLYEWGITLGGLAAFVALLIAGFQYLTSVGDPARMKDAMDRIKSTLLGLVLLLGSWLILNNISPQFTTFQTKPLDLTEIAGPTGVFCKTDDDCEASCASTTQSVIECQKYINKCRIGSGQTKEGMCYQYVKPCDYAIVYTEKNWTGEGIMLVPDNDRHHFPSGLVESVKAFYADGTSTDESAGGCTLQLFSGSWSDWGCGNRMAIIPAYESDLYRWVDQQISCVKLVPPKPPYIKNGK